MTSNLEQQSGTPPPKWGFKFLPMMSECFCSCFHSEQCFYIFLSNAFSLAYTYPAKLYRYLFKCHPWYQVNCRYQPQLENHLRLISHLPFLKSVWSTFLALLKMVSRNCWKKCRRVVICVICLIIDGGWSDYVCI